MPRMTHTQHHEWSVYIDPRTGRRAYNDLCRRCIYRCKQSHCVQIIDCRRYRSKRAVRRVE